MVESLNRRYPLAVPADVARLFKNKERILTIAYRKKVSLLCSNIPFRTAWNVFNELSDRKAREQSVPFQTFVDDFYHEGNAIYEAKRALAIEILKTHHIDPDSLTYMLDQWPEEWKHSEDILITITGNDPLPVLAPGFDPDSHEMIEPDLYDIEDNKAPSDIDEQDQTARKLYSQPDTKTVVLKRKRRSSRYEMEAEDIEWACNGYVDWYNKEVEENSCKILKSWVLEKGSLNVVYIAIDAVYVERQCSVHVKGIKPEMKEKKDRIAHWNIAIEFDGLRYCISDKTLHGSFQQLFAFLISNDLMNKYFVFLTDGEFQIFEAINKYFAPWRKTIIIDWYHLEEKVHQKMSSGIIHKMVEDPRRKAKAESEGTTSKAVKNTALSNLYARRLYSILWVGNVDKAIEYIKGIDPSVIKNQNAINDLIGYLENKRQWITCYALRKRAGLRNASNGSEGINQILVAKRQKVDGMTWSDEGSYSGSNQMVLYANNEDELWFRKRQVTFTVSAEKRIDARNAIKKQIKGRVPS